MKKIRIVRILTSIFFVAVCLLVTFHENGKVIHVWTMAYQEIQAGRMSSKLVFSLFLLFVGICGLAPSSFDLEKKEYRYPLLSSGNDVLD